MSAMGFQKKVCIEEWVCGMSFAQFLFGFLEFFNFVKPVKKPILAS